MRTIVWTRAVVAGYGKSQYGDWSRVTDFTPVRFRFTENDEIVLDRDVKMPFNSTRHVYGLELRMYVVRPNGEHSWLWSQAMAGGSITRHQSITFNRV